MSKEKGWFKRVDKGQRLGTFILETASLQTGPVKATIDELKAAIYARPPAMRAATPPAPDGYQAQAEPPKESQARVQTDAQQPEPTPEPPSAAGSADA